MLSFFVAPTEEEIHKLRLRTRLSLGEGAYWFLHRYFVHASLSPGDYSFLNQYEDTELSGYQLHRLKAELNEAISHLESKPEGFKVLVGWNGTIKTAETEDWRSVRRADIVEIINNLMTLITEAEKSKVSLFAIGD